MTNLNKRLIDVTVGELLDLIEERVNTKVVIDTTQESKRYVYGLAGIAEIFNCSKTTANRIKQSGKIDGAVRQIGNLIIVDADKAIALAGRIEKNKYTKKKQL
jgi:hypothetical protein